MANGPFSRRMGDVSTRTRGVRSAQQTHSQPICVGLGRVLPEDRGEEESGEEGGPGPP